MDDVEVRRHLADLTIVVLTRNRPGNLQGIVKYWSRWPVSLMILDGSDRSVKEESLDAGDARLVVHSGVAMNDRFDFAASRLETPFACLHSDDDFILARGAAKAIAWLKSNQQFTCVASDVLVFDEGLQPGGINSGYSLTSDEPGQRLIVHFSDYRSSYFYGIQRAEQLSVALNTVVAGTGCREYVDHPNWVAGYELGVEICGAALGRLSNSSDVLHLRRVGNKKSETVQDQGTDKWLKGPESQMAVRAWRSSLSQHLARHLDVPEMTVDGWIAEAMTLYCRQEAIKEGRRRKTTRLIVDYCRSLKPKTNVVGDPKVKALIRLVRSARTIAFRALRWVYRAFMKVIGRPRLDVYTIQELARADRRDLDEVIAILDPNYRAGN